MAQTGLGAKISHASFGEGVVYGENLQFWKIYFKGVGDKLISKEFQGLDVLEEAVVRNEDTLTLDEVQTAITSVLQRFTDFTPLVPIAQRWRGGTMVIKSRDLSIQPKEVPIDAFFHKIVMIRDRLRVLEAQINAHSVLQDDEKVQLQQYITRIYGSLTTFNILFDSKDHHFKGESGKS